jgi:uncharacterized protein (TIGR02145 family)
MKKITKLFALLFTASTIFIGCGSDDPIAVTGVTLNESALVLTVGDTETLIATVHPRDADNQVVAWTSSNTEVATVNQNGVVTAVATGTATITVTTECGAHTDICEVTVTPPLGIGAPTDTTDPGIVIDGIRWATRNVNTPGTFVVNPEDAGMFFQWNRRQGWVATGSAAPEGWDNSIPVGDTWERANDPCPPGWRVPTQQEFLSLQGDNRTGTSIPQPAENWVLVNNVRGRLFGTAPNQIFLPAAGLRIFDGTLINVGAVGVYWSSTAFIVGGGWSLTFRSDWSTVDASIRHFGLSVRCVAE